MQFQRPALVQQQKLKMSPRLYQSIQLMAMPVQDLKLRIQQELESNPALQVVADPAMVSLDEVSSKTDDAVDREEYDYFSAYTEAGTHTTSGRVDEQAADDRHGFIEGVLSRPESLQDHLLWQLRLQPLKQAAFEAAELLIRNLDEHGFHVVPPETLLPKHLQHECEPMIRLIRSFEPVGTCVSDHWESLLVQAEADPDAPELALELLRNHSHRLQKIRPVELARVLKVESAALEGALAYIRTLDPYPGARYSSDTPTYVVPDLQVRIRDGQFVILLNDSEIPVLGVDPFFDEMQAGTKEVRQFVTNRVRDAKWFIGSIEQRNRTMVRVARAIVEFQRDFFLRGPKHLAPLTLKDIAAEVGVHEATVSRITTSKYMQTEWGIFELKYFFSNSVGSTSIGPSRYSKEGVKAIIKEILTEEGTERHLSDQKISDILEKRGIKIARRTVTKYRKELAIDSSYDR